MQNWLSFTWNFAMMEISKPCSAKIKNGFRKKFELRTSLSSLIHVFPSVSEAVVLALCAVVLRIFVRIFDTVLASAIGIAGVASKT